MLEQLNLVRDMTLSLAAATSAQEILEASLGTVVRLTGATRAAALVSGADGLLRFETSIGLSERYRAAVDGHTPWWGGQSDPEPLVSSDVHVEPLLAAHRQANEAEGIRSLAFLPMVTGRGVIGKLALYFDREHQLTSTEVQVGQTIAAQAAFAVERQRAVDAARAESRRFLAGPMVVFRWKLRPGLPVDYVSSNVEHQCGYGPEQFVRDQVLYVSQIHPEDAPQVEAEVLRHAISGEGSFDLQFRVRRPDDSYHWVHAFMLLEPNEHGQSTHVLGYMLDITYQRLAAVQREATALKLREVERLDGLSTLAGGVAHDFNNMLMGVLGNAELALDDVRDPSFVAGRLRDIQRAARRAADLTRQLLAFSGRGQFSQKAIRLNTLLMDCARMLRPILANDADVVYRLESEGRTIEGDPTQIRQVVTNLLLNASDALEGGRGRIELRTYSVNRVPETVQLPADGAHSGVFAVIEVVDDGVGMDPATKATMFEPFFTTKKPGRGLGLAAVLGIVRGHHGAVDVETVAGGGTTIRVYLPALVTVATRIDSGAGGGELDGRAAEAPPQAGQRTVLVVDDEELVLDVSSRSLARAGYNVLRASSGQMAIDVIDQLDGGVDLLLIDLTMPGLSGRETLDIVQCRWPHLLAILTSGYDAAERRRVTQGTVDFLQKPYGPDKLVAAVDAVFERMAAAV